MLLFCGNAAKKEAQFVKDRLSEALRVDKFHIQMHEQDFSALYEVACDWEVQHPDRIVDINTSFRRALAAYEWMLAPDNDLVRSDFFQDALISTSFSCMFLTLCITWNGLAKTQGCFVSSLLP